MILTIKQKLHNLHTNLNLKRIILLVWSAAKSWMLISVFAIILETVFFLASLYALKVLVDKVGGVGVNQVAAEETLIKHIVLACAIAASYLIAKIFSAYVIEVQATKVAHYLDEKIHTTAISMDLSHYESPEYFDILKRAKDAGADRPNLVITTLLEILKNILNLCAVGSLFITINWFLLPLLVLFVLPTLLVRIHFSNRQNLWRIKHTPLERKSSYLSNLITSDTAAKEIRSFNLGNHFKELYQLIRIEVLGQRLSLSYKRSLNEVLTMTIAIIGFFTCIGYIALGTLKGTNTVGDIALFLMVFPQAFSLMQYISGGISILYTNSIFINSIFELFDLKPKGGTVDPILPIPSFNPSSIELKNVSFTYPHASKPTLHQINLKIPSGKIIAIVGLNGAGKSTLIKLLCRLYEPTHGQINYGENNAQQFDLAEYRRQISVVFQDFSRYNFSAEDNIRFGDINREVDKEKIIKAAMSSGAHAFIDQLPHQYQTMMGRLFEEGQEVSIGQWQKIAIARALYSQSHFLILDEATSALDVIAEKELFSSFRENIGNRAAVIISHRHSAIKHADYIYVLSAGKITQQGTDEELLQTDGDYSRLFKSSIEND